MANIALPRQDFLRWNVHGWVEKFDGVALNPALANLPGSALTAYGLEPDDRVEFHGNLLTNAGVQRLEDLLIGAGGTAFNNANTRLGVGDNATAAAATDTNLGVGGSNRYWQLMDATFPSRASQTVSFKATHTGGVSNFHWQEWGLDNGSASSNAATAPLLNRKVIDLGTKTSSASWALTVTIVVS